MWVIERKQGLLNSASLELEAAIYGSATNRRSRRWGF